MYGSHWSSSYTWLLNGTCCVAFLIANSRIGVVGDQVLRPVSSLGSPNRLMRSQTPPHEHNQQLVQSFATVRSWFLGGLLAAASNELEVVRSKGVEAFVRHPFTANDSLSFKNATSHVALWLGRRIQDFLDAFRNAQTSQFAPPSWRLTIFIAPQPIG